MQTKTTAALGNIKSRNLYRKLLGGSLASLAIFLLIYTIVPTLISEASATQDVTASTNWIATSLTLDPDYGNGSMSDAGHGDIAFGDIIPTSTADGNIGTERVIKKTIGIESSGKYYSIYLSMANDSSALKLNGDDSNIRIDPVTGTWDSPAAFSATSWGYAVPNTPVPTSASTWQESSTPEYPTFSQATTFSDASNLGIDLTKNNHGSIYNQDTWVAAPVLGSAQQIWKAETTNNYGFGGENGDSINNHFDIYYGIMVGSDTLAGTYENQLIYTALASAQAIDEISHNLLVSERFVAEGTAQTLKFDLASSQSGLIKPSQVYAYVVPHSDVTPNIIAGEQEGETRLETDEEVLIRLQNNLAQDGSYYDACSFNRTDSSTDIVFDTDGVTITCEMPAETPVWDGGLTNDATATDGYYDIWITIPSYNANYISKTTEVGTNNRVASMVYAGLQSIGANNKPYVEYMQDIEPNICKNTNMWNNIASNTGARIYDYRGNGSTVADPTPLLAAGEDTLGVSSFKLLDKRDSHPYLVRRLADGNCWMVENLDLNLADYVDKTDQSGGLTPANTDLSADRSYWDPGKTAYNAAKEIDDTVSSAQASYFPVISYDKLGTAQTYQFQPKGTSGNSYHWGSKLNEDGETLWDEDTAGVTNPLVYTGTWASPTWTARNRSSINGGTTTAYIDEARQTTFTISNNSTGGFQSGKKRYIENNSRAEMPRSYDYGWDYVTTTASAGGSTVTTDTAWDENHASQYYGDKYNWYAATAETGTWSMTSDVATDSICPKGWKLPGNGKNGADSWRNLLYSNYTKDGTTAIDDSAKGSQAMRSLPLSIPFTGTYNWVNGNASYYAGGYGFFWSSTADSQTYGYGLYFSNTGVRQQNSSNKVGGLAIRCVARD